MTEPFIFGVPLVARAAARDWARIDALFELTLRSVLAQGDGDFHLILAAHEAPPSWDRLTRGDGRFQHLPADWPFEPPTPANDDGGKKKWRIRQAVRERGGGLLMFLDADDLVDTRLVAAARASIPPEAVGGLVAEGIALDFQTLRAAALPIAGVYDRPFHHLCGSCTVARVEPGAAELVRRDPHAALGSHHAWEETAAAIGAHLVRLPVQGVYVVGTSQSHSEHDGPFAAWRRSFTEGVRRVGAPIEASFAARFGVDPARFR